MTTAQAVQAVTQHDERTLRVVWEDGLEKLFDVVSLRNNCPCASCAGGVKVNDTVRPIEIRSVGRYALIIFFDDGHRTGIYSFDNLRQQQ